MSKHETDFSFYLGKEVNPQLFIEYSEYKSWDGKTEKLWTITWDAYVKRGNYDLTNPHPFTEGYNKVIRHAPKGMYAPHLRHGYGVTYPYRGVGTFDDQDKAMAFYDYLESAFINGCCTDSENVTETSFDLF